jgi:hypothetical protein
MNFVMLLREIFYGCTVGSPRIMLVICNMKEIVILMLSEHPSISLLIESVSPRTQGHDTT